jgi:hypothetical protein
MPVTPGTKELACVCSRCGFPFSYVVPEDTQNEIHQEATKQNQSPSPEYHQRERRELRHEQRTYQRNYEERGNYDYEDVNEQEMPIPPSYHAPSSRGRGCARQAFIIFIILLIFAVFALRHFYYERSYTAESITAHEMPKMTEEDNLSEITTPEGAGDEDEFTEVRPEEPPQWLQGSWTVETSEGPINIFIKGNHIAESFKGETQSGTFYYSEGKIYCNFGKNEESIRLVDLQHQRIDAGGGLLMEKRDF